MEFHPGGLLLIAFIVFLFIFLAAALLAELLVLTKVIKQSGWPLRILFTIILSMVTYYVLTTPRTSSPGDIISVTTAVQTCNTIDKSKLTGNWEHWNVSHSKKDTISFYKDGSFNWSDRQYTGWALFCDTLVLKHKGNTSDSVKLLDVTRTNLLFRLSSSTDTGRNFSATRIENKD